jgi:hypothetical protein
VDHYSKQRNEERQGLIKQIEQKTLHYAEQNPRRGQQKEGCLNLSNQISTNYWISPSKGFKNE